MLNEYKTIHIEKVTHFENIKKIIFFRIRLFFAVEKLHVTFRNTQVTSIQIKK